MGKYKSVLAFWKVICLDLVILPPGTYPKYLFSDILKDLCTKMFTYKSRELETTESILVVK